MFDVEVIEVNFVEMNVVCYLVSGVEVCENFFIKGGVCVVVCGGKSGVINIFSG